MILITKLWSLFAIISLVSASFLVQLCSSVSVDSFIQKYPMISKDISKVYQFGAFQGIAADFVFMLQVISMTPDVQIAVNEVAEQHLAPKHLARISQRQRLHWEDKIFKYVKNFTDEINVYILDTGVFAGHSDFENRVIKSVDFTGEGIGDNNGHGTHVAGLVGSKTYGVQKEARLIDVKVLTKNGAGNLSTVLEGLEYIVNNSRETKKKSIANLSVGAAYNALLNNAVDIAVNEGIPIVVAAGNTNEPACGYSPASAQSVITVGAIDDRYDSIASFSNWGRCVDIFASGVYVASLATYRGDATLALSGTSMSSPIITGILASYMAMGLNADGAVSRLFQYATVGEIPRASIFFRPRTVNMIAYHEVSPP
ncbi:similar to Saccharomyces cerevisiae YCR045C RRT12 Probable subtilisin-family protease [Geotrichum candidum]|uniref:Similar to Saccharomyces cerevisiae YCR045C RRT12 Probable subtilisin-family protease n=1 Tax=Geotrichum candidum TaxID=1173061 RepID=A0A0J9X633_GEOCN|nr:similar to Saccharomyces cerevisiae YCR045C RRT12 Probable subtilisin-family protease [Geotrichum candidum]